MRPFPGVSPDIVEWLDEVFPNRIPDFDTSTNPLEMARRTGQREVVETLRSRLKKDTKVL